MAAARLVKNCTMLAAALSANYRSNETFSQDSLTHYLEHNGILLSMCLNWKFTTRGFRWSCDIDNADNHMSASWIQESTTRFRVFGPLSPVGVVLDPRAINVVCSYPLDALSGGRDDDGCGPLVDDPKFGSQGVSHWSGAKRWTWRAAMTAYKIHQFGADTGWHDISCDELFMTYDDDIVLYGRAAHDDDQCQAMTKGQAPVTIERAVSAQARKWTMIMDHPVCNVTDPPDPNDIVNVALLYYNGECSWNPLDWSHMINTMTEWIDQNPSLLIWNEIILEKPDLLQDAIQAVFYIPDDDKRSTQRNKRMAQSEARRLDKPLLRVTNNEGDGKALFTCDDDN